MMAARRWTGSTWSVVSHEGELPSSTTLYRLSNHSTPNPAVNPTNIHTADNIDSDMAGCIKMNAANAAGAASQNADRGETTTEEWIAASKEPGSTTGADAAPLSVAEWVAAQGADGDGCEGAGADSPPWRGVLVRTGVYTEGGDTGQAAVVVDDVEAAIDWIIDDDRFSP